MDRIRSDLSEFNGFVADDTPRETTGSEERWLYPARLLIVDQS